MSDDILNVPSENFGSDSSQPKITVCFEYDNGPSVEICFDSADGWVAEVQETRDVYDDNGVLKTGSEDFLLRLKKSAEDE